MAVGSDVGWSVEIVVDIDSDKSVGDNVGDEVVGTAVVGDVVV